MNDVTAFSQLVNNISVSIDAVVQYSFPMVVLVCGIGMVRRIFWQR